MLPAAVVSSQLPRGSAAWFNSEIDAELEDSSVVPMKINSVTWAPEIQGYLYEVRTWDGSSWVPACGTDSSGNPVKSVAMANRWDLINGSFLFDSSLFTFACVNAALGKCAMWGYWRWTSKQECKGGSCKQQDLAYWHEACQHLVRADYCGDGVPHTRNGTTIDIYDSIGVQSRANAGGFSMEAEWRHDGAHCIQHTRWTKAMDNHPYSSDLAYVQAVCPSRLAANNPAECANESSSNSCLSVLPTTSVWGQGVAVDSVAMIEAACLSYLYKHAASSGNILWNSSRFAGNSGSGPSAIIRRCSLGRFGMP